MDDRRFSDNIFFPIVCPSWLSNECFDAVVENHGEALIDLRRIPAALSAERVLHAVAGEEHVISVPAFDQIVGSGYAINRVVARLAEKAVYSAEAEELVVARVAVE